MRKYTIAKLSPIGRVSFLLFGTAMLTACRNLVTVPAPIGVVTNAAFNTSSSALQAYYYARTQLYGWLAGYQGVIFWGELLSDELTATGYGSNNWPVNARDQSPGNEPADQGVINALEDRARVALSISALVANPTDSTRVRAGEAYALLGYTEVLLAEDFCAGVPLSQILPQGGVVFGASLTTDSLLGAAQAHFDSALLYVNNANISGSDSITALANLGWGRAALDRGNYTAADSAVANVPTTFVYNLIGETNGQRVFRPTYYEEFQNNQYDGAFGFFFNIANNKGGQGLNFATAQDPRLVLDSTLFLTIDGHYYNSFGLPDSVMYYPTKFGTPAPYIPVATGIEARLIQAEAALDAGSVSTWATDLNTLRNDVAETGVTFANTLPADSTTGASTATQVAVMFRERAFWLFGTGTRLGDLRRLLRQYGADGFTANTVFPSGPYEFTHIASYENFNASQGEVYPQTYGTDVSLLLPTPVGYGGFDPDTKYVGCLTSTATP